MKGHWSHWRMGVTKNATCWQTFGCIIIWTRVGLVQGGKCVEDWRADVMTGTHFSFGRYSWKSRHNHQFKCAEEGWPEKRPTIDPYRPHPPSWIYRQALIKITRKVVAFGSSSLHLCSVVVMSPGDLRHDRTTSVTYAEKKWPMFMSRGRRYLMSFLPSNFFSHFSRCGVPVPCYAPRAKDFSAELGSK